MRPTQPILKSIPTDNASEDLIVAAMEPPRQPSLNEASASEDPSIVTTEEERQTSPSGPRTDRETERMHNMEPEVQVALADSVCC